MDRFLNSDKIITNSRYVSCQSKEAGHPVIYLKIKDGDKNIICPYCNRQFIYQDH